MAACLVLGHIGAIFLLFIRLGHYFDLNEVVQVILILSPLTGLFATAVVKFYSDTADLPPSTIVVNPMFGLICFTLCIAFLLAIFYVIFDFPFGIIRGKEEFKTAIAGIQTALGVLLGVVVTKLFPASSSP